MTNPMSKKYNYRRYLELIYFLTLRQIQVRYKQTVLGIGWTVLRPLIVMAVFTIVFAKFARIPSDGVPYPIFTFSALLPWTFFATAVTAGTSCLVGNANLIKQIYFPREIFILSAILSALFDLAVTSVIFIGMMIFYKVSITVAMLLVFPLLFIMVIFTIALSLFLSALNVHYRDIEVLVAFCLQLAMFAVPIVYSITSVPERYRALYMLNPLAVIIDGFRKITVMGSIPNLRPVCIAAGIAVAMLALAYVYFKKAEMKFADIV